MHCSDLLFLWVGTISWYHILVPANPALCTTARQRERTTLQLVSPEKPKQSPGCRWRSLQPLPAPSPESRLRNPEVANLMRRTLVWIPVVIVGEGGPEAKGQVLLGAQARRREAFDVQLVVRSRNDRWRRTHSGAIGRGSRSLPQASIPIIPYRTVKPGTVPTLTRSQGPRELPGTLAA